MFHKDSLPKVEETQITPADYEILKNDPKKLIPFIVSKKSSAKFLAIFENSLLYIPKHKNPRTKDWKIQAEKLSMNELLKKFGSLPATSQFLRKILKKKLISYENVGYFYREELWLVASDARYSIESNKTYYQNLKDNFEESLQPFANLIEIDLSRTNEKFLTEPETVSKCRSVLSCYAKRNPDIGYCQGLNFLVWELSRRRFTEEEVFWFFSMLLENILPIDYYSSMIGVMVDQRIFNDLIDECLPKISAKFKELSFDTSLFSIQWFVCIFCKNLHTALIDIVLDNIVIQGSLILFKIGLVILKILENDILKARDFPALLTLIETKSKEMRDELYFQQKINEVHLSRKILELCRSFYRTNMEEKQFTLMRDNNYSRKFRNLNHVHQKKLHETKNTCDPQSLVCKTLIEFNQTFKTNYSSFVFRQNPMLVYIIPDYFQSDFIAENGNKLIDFLKSQNLYQDFQKNTLLIGRHHHICKEPADYTSPFSPYSPFTPVDFSKIHSFNDKFNEYNQEQKNQSFLKGYLKKSVIETRKSIGKKQEPLRNLRGNRMISHCKTMEIDDVSSLENPPIHLNLKLSMDSFEESPTLQSFSNSALHFYSQNEIPFRKNKEKKEKFGSAELNFKKKKAENVIEEVKNEEKIDVYLKHFDEINEQIEENGYKMEPRTSMFLLQAKGVYNNINEDIVDKYIKDIEKSDCINFTHGFFIERSKV